VAQLKRDKNFRGLVRALQDASADGATKANAAGALLNLANGDAANKAAMVTAGAIPPLVELVRGGSDQGKVSAAGALYYLSNGNAANKAAIVMAGALPPLDELLRAGSDLGKEKAAGNQSPSRALTRRTSTQQTRSIG
jgi:hypothetical protein